MPKPDQEKALEVGERVYLREPTNRDGPQIVAANRLSRAFHQGWVRPATDSEAFAGGEAPLPVSQPQLVPKRGGLLTAPLARIGSLAAGRHRFRCRGKAELPKHSKLVHDSPVLGDLAVDDLHDM